MTEQARLAYLQEKLEAAKRQTRTGWIFNTMGAVLLATALSIGSFRGYNDSTTIGLLILMVLLFAFGFADIGIGSRREAYVMREMEKMTTKIQEN